MGILRNYIEVIGMASESNLPQVNNGQIVMYSDSGELTIPQSMESLETIYQVTLKAEIHYDKIVNTPMGKIVVIDGLTNYRVLYIGNNHDGKVNICAFNMPFNTYLEIQQGIDTIKYIDIYIIDAYFSKISPTKIYYHIIYMLNIAIDYGKNPKSAKLLVNSEKNLKTTENEDIVYGDSVPDTEAPLQHENTTYNDDTIHYENATHIKDTPQYEDTAHCKDTSQYETFTYRKDTLQYETTTHIKDIPQYEDTAHCEDTLQYEDTAHCEDTLQREDTAHCEDTLQREDTAHCEDTLQCEDTAHCKDTLQREDTAHCEDTLQYEDTAHCEDTLQCEDTAHCEDTLQYEDTAHCEDTLQCEDTAHCEDTLQCEDTAHCEDIPTTLNDALDIDFITNTDEKSLSFDLDEEYL